MERIKVYLAGPLTNVEKDGASSCAAVRNVVKEVLGRHCDVYDPGDRTAPGSDHTADEVYVMDHERTSTADLVIFHLAAPSLGVGIESQIAAEATIPKVVLSRANVSVSRMFRGVFSPTVAEIEYHTPEDLRTQLQGALPAILEKVSESKAQRDPFIGLIAKGQLGREVYKARIYKQVSLADLADRTGVAEHFIRAIERNDELAVCCSVMNLMRLGEQLRVFFNLGGSLAPTVSTDVEGLSPNQQTSLDHLVDFVSWWEGKDPPRKMKDSRPLEMWEYYTARHVEVAHRSGRQVVGARHGDELYTVDDWAKLYEQLYGMFKD